MIGDLFSTLAMSLRKARIDYEVKMKTKQKLYTIEINAII